MWKKYEKQILKKTKQSFSGYQIKHNDKVKGIFSGSFRQVDISLRKQITSGTELGAIETKCYNKKIDVQDVDSFIGFLQDIGAQFGVMITNKGFTKGAINRTRSALIRTEIIKFSDWDDFDFSWVDEQDSIYGNRLTVRCEKCNQLIVFKDDELAFEVTEQHERSMGPERYHNATWEGYCPKCDNLISFSLEIIEYPVGCKTLGFSEQEGCEIIKRPEF